MLIVGQLLRAKYKNIQFYVRRESIDQLGQKRITHDYPNTQTRYMEAQGIVPAQFTLDIFFSGISWRSDFQEFKSAIEEADSGRLTLPTFGVIENVVALPTRAESNQTSIGEISMTVTFSVTVEKPSPTEADASAEDVSESAEISRGALEVAFSGL
jgi:prophage DNA circulation protein